ncbi:hypothetical protein Afil01_65330 [Actinorhabdospora filicis]|uniref:Uncharacterized protein n=1 Tax=Actinorhabdospora filicis TaxID=1785913 RepID=A0A9W6WDL2_9ACTN|nr:hypothetical protein Afil01_65330 [Actinorhabdospora filicis]
MGRGVRGDRSRASAMEGVGPGPGGGEAVGLWVVPAGPGWRGIPGGNGHALRATQTTPYPH